MRVWIEQDPTHLVWTLRTSECVLNTHDDVQRWAKLLDRALVTKGEDRVVIFVDLAGMHIGSHVAAAYGEVAQRVFQDHAVDIFRYGHPQGMTESVIHLQAVLHHFPSNIYADRAAALAALAHVRRAA